MEIREYSKKSDYDDNIKPLVKKIMLLCEQYQIPAFMTFAVNNDNSRTDYVTEISTPGSYGFSLTNDEISKHILVKAGFYLVPSEPNLGTDLFSLDDKEDSELSITPNHKGIGAWEKS